MEKGRVKDMTLLYENFRLAISSLKANKMRALLTMLGIIIGISSVIAIMTVGDSLTKTLTSTMSGFGVNNIDVYLNFRDDYEGEYYVMDDDWLSKDMIYDVCNRFEKDIEAISVKTSISGTEVEYNGKKGKVSAEGTSLGTFLMNDVKLVKGRYFTQAENDSAAKVAIVSDKLVSIMFDGKNNDAIGSVISYNVDGRNFNLTIVGIYEYVDAFAGMGLSSGDNVQTAMYVPYNTAVNITHDEYITYFQVRTFAEIDQDDFVKRVENYINTKYYGNNDRMEVFAYSMASMVGQVATLMNTLTIAISVIAGIALLVGGIGVMNIMLVSITERTREIGTRKALGAPNSSIRVQFIVESIVICLIGGLIGIILGCEMGMTAAALMKCSVAPSIRGIIISLTFSMAIGLFFGYYPANKAAKMDPIEALRYE